MPYALRRFACVDCGVLVEKRANERAEIRCLPHALAWSAEVQRQLHNHCGPMYDRWVFANLAAAMRMCSSTAPVEWPLAALWGSHRNPPGRTLTGGVPFLTCVFPPPIAAWFPIRFRHDLLNDGRRSRRPARG